MVLVGSWLTRVRAHKWICSILSKSISLIVPSRGYLYLLWWALVLDPPFGATMSGMLVGLSLSLVLGMVLLGESFARARGGSWAWSWALSSVVSSFAPGYDDTWIQNQVILLQKFVATPAIPTLDLDQICIEMVVGAVKRAGARNSVDDTSPISPMSVDLDPPKYPTQNLC